MLQGGASGKLSLQKCGSVTAGRLSCRADSAAERPANLSPLFYASGAAKGCRALSFVRDPAVVWHLRQPRITRA